MLVAASQIDPSLLPFLAADDTLKEAAALVRLNAEEIEPIIKRGVGYKLFDLLLGAEKIFSSADRFRFVLRNAN